MTRLHRTSGCSTSTMDWEFSTGEPSTSFLRRSSFDLAAVYQEMLRREQLAGFEVTDRFYEIGSVEGLEETRKHLSEHDFEESNPRGSCHTQRSSWPRPSR